MNAQQFLAQLAQKPTQRRNGEHLLTMSFLAEQTGLTEYPIPIILITGTCGKGSTQLFLSSILQANGYHVGLIQSPHLISFSERIQRNQKPLPEAEILNKINELLPVFESCLSIYPPNYNQIFLTVGLHLFLKDPVDFILIESGIGGYSDPCSYFDPLLSIITNIHKDHEFLLGNTHESIAYDKSGIIKYKKQMITGAMVPEAIRILREEALKKEAPFFALGEHFHMENKETNMIYSDEELEFPIPLNDLPDFQWNNIALAMKASLLIKDAGYKIELEQVCNGILQTKPPGRFEIISNSPLIVVDGAHNEEEIRQFCDTVRKLGCKHAYLIVGFSSNKDVAGMVSRLKSIEGTLLLTPHSNTQRTSNRDQLHSYIQEFESKCLLFDCLEDAFHYALQNLTEDDGILFTGSMFLAGDALKLLQSRDTLRLITEQ
ncbi:MAG TPA: cyanophycin synthetase [Bacillota bacterium]|nr:cyanophycin synthetase [Bacillota bacterium]